MNDGRIEHIERPTPSPVSKAGNPHASPARRSPWRGPAYNVVQSQSTRVLTEPPIAPPRSAFAQTVAAVGLIEPSSEAISIGSPRSAVVDVVQVKAGDEVKKDQALIKLAHSRVGGRKSGRGCPPWPKQKPRPRRPSSKSKSQRRRRRSPRPNSHTSRRSRSTLPTALKDSPRDLRGGADPACDDLVATRGSAPTLGQGQRGRGSRAR